MDTIFNFNATAGEINRIAFNYLTMRIRCGNWTDTPTKEWYVESIKKEWALFDIATLFEDRQLFSEAAKFWDSIPELYMMYKIGNDYIINE